jgi:hypothetical protein
MRVLINFMLLRDVWHVHCITEDARTPISPFRTVRDQATLIRLLRYVGATDANIEEVHERIRKWSRGSVYVDLVPGRENLLRIRRPWSAEAHLVG